MQMFLIETENVRKGNFDVKEIKVLAKNFERLWKSKGW